MSLEIKLKISLSQQMWTVAILLWPALSLPFVICKVIIFKIPFAISNNNNYLQASNLRTDMASFDEDLNCKDLKHIKQLANAARKSKDSILQDSHTQC